MTLGELRDLVAAGEGERLELKETTGQRTEACKALCAFLNREGGTVVFGATDRGEVRGQQVSDRTKRELAEVFGRFEPAADIGMEFVGVGDGREAIVCSVEKGSGRPYVWEGRPYKRVQSTTVAMPQEEYERILSERKGFQSDWELQVNPALSMDNLDVEEIRKTARMGIEAGRLPETTDTGNAAALLDGFKARTPEGLRNAAAVLFCKPDTDYAQCLLRLARFKGTDKSVFLDNKQVTGNIFRLLDAGMAFCFDHLALSGTVVGLYREEHLEVPVAALREALVNALVHRLYVRRGTSVSLAIYDDRIEIANPGSFPPGWTAVDLERGSASEPRNPVIARVLYLRKMLESWGRGIKLMMDECAKAGLPKPAIESDGRIVQVVFARPKRVETGGATTGELAPKPSELAPNDDNLHRSGAEVAPNNSELASMTQRIEAVLENALQGARADIQRNATAVLTELVRDDGATLRDIATRTDLSLRTVNNSINILKSHGLLGREGTPRRGRWLISLNVKNTPE